MRITLALIAALVAALYSASTWAQDGRLSTSQIVVRAYNTDCLYPDLRNDPDFRVCNYHLLGRGRTTETRGTSLVKLRDLAGAPHPRAAAYTMDESWLLLLLAPGRPYVHLAGFPAYLADRQTVYAPGVTEVLYGRQDPVSIGSFLPATFPGAWGGPLTIRRPSPGCARDSACYAEYPWYSDQWNMMTPDQVGQYFARFRVQVSRGCNIGNQPDYSVAEVVVLTMSEDGSIAGSCEPHDPDAEAQAKGDMQAAPLPYGSHSLMPSAFQDWPTMLGEPLLDQQSQWRERGGQVRHLEPLNGER